MHLGFDEASCAQLVYLYSVIREKLKDNSGPFFNIMGRDRCVADKKGSNKTVRIASIDIGGGTSDLMITEYRNTSSSDAVTRLEAKSLFQEGVSVAGDDVVRNLIREALLPSFTKWAAATYGPEEIRIEHLETFLGVPHYKNQPQYVELKKRFIDTVMIPLAHKFLEHAQSKTGPDVITKEFVEIEFSPAPQESLKRFFTETLSEIIGRGIFPTLDETKWEMDRWAVNDVIYNTLYQTLRIFSEVIVHYDCDLILLAGKMSALPEVRDILVDYCPVPPHRIVSLSDFEAGKWYPFDLERDCIKDAKTTVVVGAALWFFGENLRALRNLGLTSNRELIDKGTIFIGQIQNRQVKNKDLVFPKGAKNLFLVGRTYLGARRINCEDGHANILYEVAFGGTNDYETPISVILRQDPRDKSDIKIVQAVDAKGRDVKNLKISLRTLEEDLYWLDQGSL